MATIEGKKTGGRRKGVPNKITQDLAKQLDELGFNPASELVQIFLDAKEEYARSAEIYDAIQDARIAADVKTPLKDTAPEYLKIAASACADLMQYVYPKRKAIEHTGANGSDLFGSFTQMVERVTNASKPK